jgi:hypothetical protein
MQTRSFPRVIDARGSPDGSYVLAEAAHLPHYSHVCFHALAQRLKIVDAYKRRTVNGRSLTRIFS